MSLTKRKAPASTPKQDPKSYPTWEAFVQAKVDRTNELLNRMDQDTLRKLIESEQQPGPENQS